MKDSDRTVNCKTEVIYVDFDKIEHSGRRVNIKLNECRRNVRVDAANSQDVGANAATVHKIENTL